MEGSATASVASADKHFYTSSFEERSGNQHETTTTMPPSTTSVCSENAEMDSENTTLPHITLDVIRAGLGLPLVADACNSFADGKLLFCVADIADRVARAICTFHKRYRASARGK